MTPDDREEVKRIARRESGCVFYFAVLVAVLWGLVAWSKLTTRIAALEQHVKEANQ